MSEGKSNVGGACGTGGGIPEGNIVGIIVGIGGGIDGGIDKPMSNILPVMPPVCGCGAGGAGAII